MTAPMRTGSLRGGARPGAGRPKGSGRGLDARLHFCCTPAQEETWHALGGAVWARQALDHARSIAQGVSRPVRIDCAPGRVGRFAWIQPGASGWRRTVEKIEEGAFFLISCPAPGLPAFGAREGDALLFVRKNAGGPGCLVLADADGRPLLETLGEDGRLPRTGKVLGLLAGSFPPAPF